MDEAAGERFPPDSTMVTPGCFVALNIVVLNRQRRFRIDRSGLARVVRQLIRLAFHRRCLPFWETLEVVVSDDAHILEFKRRLGLDPAPTDVLAFAYAPVAGVPEGSIAEIVVNVERAARTAPKVAAVSRRPWTLEQELTLYVAHGIDHLAGGRDSNAVGRRRMRVRELRWVTQLTRTESLKGLIETLPPAAPFSPHRRTHRHHAGSH